MHCNVDLSTTQQLQGQAQRYSFLISKKAQIVANNTTLDIYPPLRYLWPDI
jgi:hypothetical protein